MAGAEPPSRVPILLVPIYLGARPCLVQHLEARLEEVFSARVEVKRPFFDPERALDRERGQYHSSRLLDHLARAPGEGKVVGITGVDLFVPVLTWVFGEAHMPGRAAVASIHRLRSEIYGLPADEERLFERAEKEVIHELGHTWGLAHCENPRCVMRASTWVDEIDLKSSAFCHRCLAVLRGAPKRCQ